MMKTIAKGSSARHARPTVVQVIAVESRSIRRSAESAVRSSFSAREVTLSSFSVLESLDHLLYAAHRGVDGTSEPGVEYLRRVLGEFVGIDGYLPAFAY